MDETIFLIDSLPSQLEALLCQPDYLDLTWEERCKPRHKAVTAGGITVALSLSRGTYLSAGTVLYNAADLTIVVRAKPEPVLVIQPRDLDEQCRVAKKSRHTAPTLYPTVRTKPAQPQPLRELPGCATYPGSAGFQPAFCSDEVPPRWRRSQGSARKLGCIPFDQSKKQARGQCRELKFAPSAIRTQDHSVKSRVLYR
jgi:hypothetical protein